MQRSNVYSSDASEAAFDATGRMSHSYFLRSKSSFATPTVAHKFTLDWPWPTTTVVEERAPSSSTSADAKPLRKRPRPRAEDSAEDEHAPSTTAPAAHGDDEGGTAPELSFDMSARRHSRPTLILALSADPHPASKHYEPHRTQRVAVTLSPGHRLHLPLLVSEQPAGSVGVDAGRPQQYWRSAYKPSRHSPRACQPPMRTELVIGELASIEWVSKSLRERSAHRSPLSIATSRAAGITRRVDLSAAPSASSDSAVTAESPAVPSWCRPYPPPSQLPVYSFLMHSVPAATRWLTAVPERLLVSLPCEERLVTLHASRAAYKKASTASESAGAAARETAGYEPGQPTPVPLMASHSFQLPRGVVPLDVAEVPQRPFVAVGTYEHGVLVCWLNVHTGAVEQLVQSLSLCGIGSAVFPVTHLACVFPPRRSLPQPHLVVGWPRRAAEQPFAGAENNPAGASARPGWTGQHRAAALASLADGAVLCCSPFDPQPLLLKNIGSADGTIERFAAACTAPPLLHFGGPLDFDVGVLATTRAGPLMRLYVVEPATSPGCAPTGRCDSGSNDDDSSEEGHASRTGTSAAGSAHGGRGTDAVLAAQELKSQAGAVAVSERVEPTVARLPVVPAKYSLLRVGDTAAVYQLKPTSYDPVRGFSARHFLPAVSTSNEVLLLDRNTTVYKALSKTLLTPMERATGGPVRDELAPRDVDELFDSTAPDGAMREEQSQEQTLPARAQSRTGQSASAPGPALDDLCTGVVVLSAGHQWLCVAAAHHGNVVTVLTYASEPEFLGVREIRYHGRAS